MKSQYTDDQWQSLAQRYGIAQPPQLFRAAWTNVGLDLNKTAEFLAAGIVSPKAALDSTHGAASRAMAQRPEGAGPNDFEFTYEKRGNKVFFKARVSGARLRATYNTREDTAEFWFNGRGAGVAANNIPPFKAEDGRMLAWADADTGLDGKDDTDENLATLDAFMVAVSTVARTFEGEG